MGLQWLVNGQIWDSTCSGGSCESLATARPVFRVLGQGDATGAGGWSQKVGEMMVVDGYFTMKKGDYGSRLLEILTPKGWNICVCGLM